MTLDDIRDAVTQAWHLAQDHANPILTGAGAAGVLLAVLLAVRFFRTGQTHDRLGTLAVLLATGFAMEGMYEVATDRLGLGWAGGIVFCGTFEILAAWLGSMARHRLSADPDADVYEYMRWLWIVAAASGVIACSAGTNVTEVLLRLVSPAGAALVWWVTLVAGRRQITREASSWIWTPRRIGVHLGLLQPGDGDDLTEVFRQRRIDRMVRQARKMRHARPRRAARYARRFEEMAERVDAATVAEVRARVQRGVTAQQEVFGRQVVTVDDRLTQGTDAPSTAPVAHPADAPAPTVTHPAPPAAPRFMTHPAPGPRRTREVVMKRPMSAPPADRDAALAQAVNAVLSGAAESLRAAARDADVPEATLRRHVTQARADAQPAQKVNGYAHTKEN